MRFPLAEADILVLSQDMVSGFEMHPEKFPQPPANPAALEAAIAAFKTLAGAAVEAQALAQAATAAKRESLEALVTLMKSDLRYAEMVSNRDDVMLKYLGWSAPREKMTQPVPGQPGTLIVADQAEDQITLTWQAPTDGGRVLAYRVQRRPKIQTPWQEIATALESVITLTGQPTSEVLEYRIVAMNKTGTGPGSNAVRVKL